MWAKGDKKFACKAFESAKKWAKIVRERLHMKRSGNNVIISDGGAARAAQRALLEEGVMGSIEAHGVDVGADVTAGLARTQRNSGRGAKLRQRERGEWTSSLGRTGRHQSWAGRGSTQLSPTATRP